MGELRSGAKRMCFSARTGTDVSCIWISDGETNIPAGSTVTDTNLDTGAFTKLVLAILPGCPVSTATIVIMVELFIPIKECVDG
ncbi:MAG: hypothetical protein GY832_44250 [Chloroflexi bacterium]|nr:hypothetical protein [Chloroflexota bacterium]